MPPGRDVLARTVVSASNLLAFVLDVVDHLAEYALRLRLAAKSARSAMAAVHLEQVQFQAQEGFGQARTGVLVDARHVVIDLEGRPPLW